MERTEHQGFTKKQHRPFFHSAALSVEMAWNALQRCTLEAEKRFTFATGQCRERHHRPCGNGLERTALQRCTQNAGKRFTFATGQYRERRHRRCGNGKERTPLQRCTQNAGKRFTFATGQYRERRHRRCGNGLERTALQRCRFLKKVDSNCPILKKKVDSVNKNIS